MPISVSRMVTDSGDADEGASVYSEHSVAEATFNDAMFAPKTIHTERNRFAGRFTMDTPILKMNDHFLPLMVLILITECHYLIDRNLT